MNESVLIVDDSLTVRMDLREALDEAGFACLDCASLAEARIILAARPVDAVVLDRLLPDGDGTDLLRELRATPAQADCVVLMLSTETEVRDRLRGLRMGADEYVGKPYDRRYVAARARELLRAKRTQGDDRATTILVIDDSLSFREALREGLQGAGYEVLLAATGEEGLLIAAAARPTALLIDSVLPGLDGAGVIRRLRLDVALRSVPCVLMTAADERDAELRALDAGADAFVRKQENVDFILARLAAVLRSAATSAPERSASPSGPKRILAVDDSPTYLAGLAEMLRNEGYDVVPAKSGEEALELLALQGMDCILMDLMMPGLSGRETCSLIKAAPLVRDIPLIMLTGLDDRSAMLDALEVGADDYIQKSSEFEVLKARVRAQLRRKQFEDDNRRIRMELLNVEIEAAEARAARALAASRAELLAQLEHKNGALELSNKELASANRAKSEFLSTMSHELRTPLNAIIGFSEILKEGMSGPLTPRQREFTRHINDSGKHLLALINDILDLSKIEAGKLDIDLEPVDLDSVLTDALTVVKERANARQIVLDASFSGLSAALQADRRRLKQVFYNLLSNAVKFSPDGGRVGVRAVLVSRAQASDGLPGFANGLRMPLPPSHFDRFVQISVQDNGIGLSMKDMEKLFKPFAQIKNDVTRTVEGTGLGLVTVARLVDLHQGTVAVTSLPGQGSCFTFWLPWHGGDESGTALADEARPGAGLPLALVVEDDAAAAALMRAQLESVGFAVRHASSAEAALELVDDYTPDLITLDVRLPGMDGWDFLCRLQNLPSWADVPVVVVSVDDQHEVGLSLGASAVLQKPFSRTDFVHELDQLGFKPTPTRDVRVLVIDDNVDTPELLDNFLSKPGYAVSRASGGLEGIELTRRDLPDLVVLDLLMCDKGGIEVVEALKGDERTAGIPVIMLAAKEFSDADRQQLNAHVQSVIDKANFRPDRFLHEVRRAFGRGTRVQ